MKTGTLNTEGTEQQAAQAIRRHLYLFAPRFAEKVRRGEKEQTIRPFRKRMPVVGDLAEFRYWSGKPYRSPQIKIGLTVITGVHEICLGIDHVRFKGDTINHTPWLDRFAIADGFQHWGELVQWFYAQHGEFPFRGFLTQWQSIPFLFDPPSA